MLVEIISIIKVDIQKKFIETLNFKTKEVKEILMKFIESNVLEIAPYEIHIKIDSIQDVPEKWDKVIRPSFKFSLNGED